MSKQAAALGLVLPGQHEILRVQQALTDLPNNCIVATLFGEQDKANQQAAIASCA